MRNVYKKREFPSEFLTPYEILKDQTEGSEEESK